MKNKYCGILIIFFFVSCVTKENQYLTVGKTKQRHGKWIEKTTDHDGVMTQKGKYDKGEKIGVWKVLMNDKLYQKDVTKGDIIYTKIYYPNGKIMEKGQSKTIVNNEGRNWFYFGEWKYFDEKGRLVYIKTYKDGNKVDSINVQDKKQN